MIDVALARGKKISNERLGPDAHDSMSKKGSATRGGIISKDIGKSEGASNAAPRASPDKERRGGGGRGLMKDSCRRRRRPEAPASNLRNGKFHDAIRMSPIFLQLAALRPRNGGHFRPMSNPMTP